MTVGTRTELDRRYSDPEAEAVPWPQVERLLADAELYWLATLRPEAGPHVTPVIGLWREGAGYVCTGEEEQKFQNLAADPHATLTTGRNDLHDGTDVVVEARAVRVSDDAVLGELADALRAKYGQEWSFGVADGAFVHEAGGRAVVLRLVPDVVYAFGKNPYTHARYTPAPV